MFRHIKVDLQKQLLHLDDFGNKLLKAIDNKSWDQALKYSHAWSECIEQLFSCISSDQGSLYRADIINIINQHQFIVDRLKQLRAKTLTQLQETMNSNTLNQYYNGLS